MNAAAHAGGNPSAKSDPQAVENKLYGDLRFAEQPTEATEDQLDTQIYQDNSSQNTAAIQIFIAAAAMGINYAVEVKRAYALLKKPLDAEKLVKDPVYRERVKRALQLVSRHDRGALRIRKSKYTDTIERTKTALKHVDASQKQILAEASISARNSHLPHLQKTFGFDAKTSEVMHARALEQMEAHPGMTMRNALAIEARKQLRSDIAHGLNKKDSLLARTRRAFSPTLQREREKLVGQRLRAEFIEKWSKYSTNTQLLWGHERERQQTIITQTISDVSTTLGVEPKLQAQPTATVPAATTPSQPAQTITAQPAQTPAIQKSQGPAAPKAQFKLPRFLGNIQNRVQNRFSSVSNGINRFSFRVSSGLNNAFGGAGRRLRSFGGLGRGLSIGGNNLLSKGGNLVADGTKAAGEKALSSMLSGLGNLMKNIRALNITATTVAVVVFGAFVFIVAMPLFQMMLEANIFPMPDKPIKTSTKARNRLATNWNSFEKNYLTYKQIQLGNDTITWQQFEKDYLSNLSYLTDLTN